ncbi:putative deoxyribonuclease TATDN2 [Physella acuta]|uniref:putative deoxyribonuclease TATDN2 n=1 Tax=Physella acuta TaxID=109671 RepID=UPI0027DB0272|nr:putative deoxyribonuclease TATDN2 [Physella acuta]
MESDSTFKLHRRRSSSDRRKSSDKRQPVSNRRQSSPIRRQSSPVRRQSSPVRRQSSPVRRQSSPVRRQSSDKRATSSGSKSKGRRNSGPYKTFENETAGVGSKKKRGRGSSEEDVSSLGSVRNVVISAGRGVSPWVPTAPKQGACRATPTSAAKSSASAGDLKTRVLSASRRDPRPSTSSPDVYRPREFLQTPTSRVSAGKHDTGDSESPVYGRLVKLGTKTSSWSSHKQLLNTSDNSSPSPTPPPKRSRVNVEARHNPRLSLSRAACVEYSHQDYDSPSCFRTPSSTPYSTPSAPASAPPGVSYRTTTTWKEESDQSAKRRIDYSTPITSRQKNFTVEYENDTPKQKKNFSVENWGSNSSKKTTPVVTDLRLKLNRASFCTPTSVTPKRQSMPATPKSQPLPYKNQNRKNNYRKSESFSSFSLVPEQWSREFVARSQTYSHKFIDSHCHIDFIYKQMGLDRGTSFPSFKAMVSASMPANYEGCVAVFCDPNTFADPLPRDTVLKSVAGTEGIWFAFGCHPKSATGFTDSHLKGLKKVLKRPKVVALGEIGLDYSGTFHRHADVQKRVLRVQLQLALDLDLPLVIHCRDADDDCLEIMQEMVPQDHSIHLHCFTRDEKTARRWLTSFTNLYIGLTPVITYQSAVEPMTVAARIPLNRLLLETDAPYFVPGEIREKFQ